MAKARLHFAQGGRLPTLLVAALAVVAVLSVSVQVGLLEFSGTARAVCNPPGEPIVVTDKADYSPAETVVIEGCGLGAWEGQNLTVTVTRPNGSVDTATVTVSLGKFTYNYLLDGILGIYQIDVLDSGSNVIAATTFTDHTSGIVLVRDNSDAFFADSYTTDAFGVTLDISWTGTPDVTQARFLNDPTPEDACPAFVAEPWLPITEIGVTNTATFPWTITGDTVSGLRKVCSQTAYGTVGTPQGPINAEDTIFFRRPNPSLTQTCGLDVVVVMDHSGSIDAGELASEKAAINGIVTALMPETPTQMALVTFDTSATLTQAFTASEATMTAAVNGVPTTANFTNWDDAIADGRVLLPNRAGNADLIIVVSDGHPNRRGGHTLLTHTAGVSGAVTESAAMGWAIAEANQAKLDGARIIGLGEGGDLSVNNMIGISGTSVHPPAAVSTSVDVFTADFGALASALATFAGANCNPFINVHKTIDADGNLGTTGDQSPGAGWTFNCNAAPDTCIPASGDTNGAGDITFEVTLGGDSSATASIVEPGEPGFAFVSASCTKNGNPIGTPGSGQVTGITVTTLDVVNCTFYNRPAAYLTVNKSCVPLSDTGLFNLRIDGTTYGADRPCGGSAGPILLTPGAHTVSETAGTGTNLANYDMTISGDCAANGSITLAAGDNRTCTITNTRKPTLTVNKICVPASDPGLFNLRIDGTTYGADTPCGGSSGPLVLSVGPHTVSETAGTGTNLANYDTTIGGDCAANGSITLAAGENKTCTVTNTRKPTLTVNKVCVPASDPGLFNLRIDATTYGADKPCGGSTGAVLLSVGPHTVSETGGTGTNLATYGVTVGGDCAANGSVTLAAGENKTCTITNEAGGTVIIRKQAVPDDAQDFSFNCTTLGAFQLDDDGAEGNPLNSSVTFNGVVPGNYDCTESQVSGWLIEITCVDPDNGTTIEPPTAHIDVDGGETVECTFTNTFVPGQQAVGGIMGLLDGSGNAPPAEGAAGAGSGRERAAAIALMTVALAAFVGLIVARRRRA